MRLSGIIWVAVLAAGVSAPGQDRGPATIWDLMDQFVVEGAAGKPPRSDDSSFLRHFYVTRKGKREECVVLVAPVTIRAGLAGIKGDVTLKCRATPVFNIGDGFQMDVFVTHGAEEALAYSRYFDAGRRSRDREWITFSVPLKLGDSGDAALRIRLSAGPQGDLVDDWLALSYVRLVRKESVP